MMPQKAKKLDTQMHLQITPMASIFTVIIVLLLKSFSVEVSAIESKPELQLPEVATAGDTGEGTKVEITEGAVLFDGRPVVTLQGFEIAPEEVDGEGSLLRLSDEVRRNADPAKAPVQKALILADQRTPYATIKRVFTSMAHNGFSSLKLVVVRGE